MRRPVLLDLFCGAGGAGMGYHRAGFDVLGVDIVPQPHYPFAFVQTEALEFCRIYGGDFDAIHASPPCQEYSVLRHIRNKHYPDLVAPTRAALMATGKPWVIENVQGAPLHAPIVLCGFMFGLPTYRHRLFEVPVLWMRCPQPFHPRHSASTRDGSVVSVHDGGHRVFPGHGHATFHADHTHSAAIFRKVLDIDWMVTRHELSQAIPPAYTQWIGERLLATL